MRSCSDTDRYSPRVVSQKSDSLRYCWKFKKFLLLTFFWCSLSPNQRGRGKIYVTDGKFHTLLNLFSNHLELLQSIPLATGLASHSIFATSSM